MKITLCGVRGSIAVPGPDTVRYGGNTTCIHVEGKDGTQLIIDGGTGIRALGERLLAAGPLACSIFITHTHWDHIQGLPFFVPFFLPGNQVDIYGAYDPIYGKDLKTILAQQMEYCYFPVRESELKAKISYNHVTERQPVKIGSLTVTPLLVNHPVYNFGYRIEEDGKVFFFTGDYEPPYNIYEPADEDYEDYQRLIVQQKKTLVDFIRGADVVVADTQYTLAEYASRKGWGHGTYDSSIEMARMAAVKSLYFTHHDPNRTDDQLDAIFSQLQSRQDLPATRFAVAREGETIEL